MSKNKHVSRFLLVVFILASLACSLVSGIGEQISGTKNTAEAVASEVSRGLDLAATAQAIFNQVGGSGLLQTAQAVATQMGDSGLLQTAQAVATQYGPDLLDTAQAAATAHPGLLETAHAAVTQQAPGLLETARAVATDQGPGLIETAQAAATQFAAGTGVVPEDVPLVAGELENLFASEGLVAYFTGLAFGDVVDFYKAQMPANGWAKLNDGSIETMGMALLIYEKGNRKATVTLTTNPLDQKTIVLITIITE